MPTEMVIALAFTGTVALILIILFRGVPRAPPGPD